MKMLLVNVLLLCVASTLAKDFGKDIVDNEKLRVCIVEGKGLYKKAAKFCPILESQSNIECVIGVDRLDCVRRINKGSAHFGVFSSEDLVAARWAGVEVLVTSEMRFHKHPFEYEVVAIVDNEAGIYSTSDLRGSKFCHPGYGLSHHWSEILANYFESTLTIKQCETELTLTESKIKASADYFGPSCKPGPWVPDPIQDRILKQKYPSLCEICDRQYSCSTGDKYWGRLGPLLCVTSGKGEVAWTRLDDVKSFFGMSGLRQEADPNNFSFLCQDGHLQPLTSKHPCVWVAKPWPAIAAKRTHSKKVQDILDTIGDHQGNDWKSALLHVLETYHVNVTALDVAVPIDNYLDQAVGFQGAYSFSSCNPPRSIVYCTTSLIEHSKCSWLQEAASTYGVEPSLQCIRAEHLDRCLDDIQHNVADVVLVSQDDRLRAERDFNLKPVLYEYSSVLHDRYVIVAVTHKSSKINSFYDIKGRKVCFPSFEGAAYMSVVETLWNKTGSFECPFNQEVTDYFGDNSCTWGPNKMGQCNEKYKGDIGALKCLTDGGDVAFMSLEVFKNFTNGNLVGWNSNISPNKFKTICPYGLGKNQEFCYLHWTPRGHLMINNNTMMMRKNEIYNTLRDIDKLFGKFYKAYTTPFTMYGPFDRQNNVLFRDSTDSLRGMTELVRDRSERGLENSFSRYAAKKCIARSSAEINFSLINSLIFVVVSVLLNISKTR